MAASLAGTGLIVAAEHAGAVVPVRCAPVAPSVGGGSMHALFLGSDGTVRAAGRNSFGQLGNNSQTSTATPVTATGLTGVTAVASSPGGDHSVALKSDGTVWTWGINWWGQLGNGEMNFDLSGPSVPAKVSGVSDVVAVAAGDFHTLALTDSGTVWAWGRNYVGELGDGTTNDSAVPVQVTGLTGVVAIAAGSNHSLAVKSNGEVWSWGENDDAQLGLGMADYLPHMTPARVPGITNATGVAAGYRHSLAITSAGTAYGWGYNDTGAAGPGFTGGPINPTPVFGLTSLVAIAAGFEHSLALKSDGSVWSWGWSVQGQLGNGYYGYSAFTGTPIQVAGVANAKVIAAPGMMSFAVRSDGKIFGWGDNDHGQLGLGSGTDRTSPVQLPTVTQATPAVPTDAEAVAGEQIALVTWEAPASVVTQYVVTPYRNGVAQAPIGTALPKLEYPVPFLVAGDTYKFEVAAQNCLGEGPASAQTNSVVPVDVQRDETGFSIEGWSLNDRHDLGVNISNGNLRVDAGDVSIAGTGMPLVVSRSYNSRGTTTSVFGNNWATSLGSDIRLEVLVTGSVYFHGPGGAKVGFAKNGTTFTAPAGTDSTLTQDATTGAYTLRHNFDGTRMEFSMAGQLVRGVDRNGNTMTYTYVASRLSKVTDTQNRDLTLTYDGAGRVRVITDVTSRQWQYDYDATGNLITYTDPANGITRYEYDASGRLNRIKTPGDTGGSRIVEFTYDGTGRLAKLKYPQHAGATTACSGNLAISTTCFTYQTRQTIVTDGNGNTTTYDVDAIGRTTMVTDALGNTTSNSYTSNSNVKRRSVGSATTSYSYTPGNALSSASLGTGAGFNIEYGDTAHPFLPTKITDPQGNKTAYVYDGPGNVLSRKNDLPVDNTVSVTRNAKGLPATARDARNQMTSYSYDGQGNLTKLTPPAPLGDYDVTYDALSRIETVTDGKNQVTRNEYDAMDRITKTTFSDGSTVRYEYDGDGNLVKMIDVYGSTVMTYDRRNNLASRTTPDGNVVSYTYDGVGNLASVTDSAGTVTYSYNGANLLSAVAEPDGDATAVSYDKDYNRARVAYPNGVAVYSTYDASRRLTKTTAFNRALQPLLSYEYRYQNAAGNDTALRQSVKDKAGNVTAYTYDVLNRLTGAKTTAPGGSTLAEYAYGYDGAGNRTFQTVYDGVRTVTTNYMYNAANQLAGIDGLIALSYDGNGNYLGANTGDEHAYNAKEQTVSVRRAGRALTMRYEGAGQRDRSSVGAPGDVPLVSFTNSVLGVTQERLASGVRRDYVLDDTGQVLAQTTTAGTYYTMTDGLGSTVALTGEDGSLAGTVEYSPYGQTTKVTGAAVTMPFRFAGVYLDPTGLYKMGERYYDPSLGRFTQQDPVHDPFNPKQWNRYLYVGGDPVNFVDPTGMKSWWRKAWDWAWDATKCMAKTLSDIAWIIPSEGNAWVELGTTVATAGAYLNAFETMIMVAEANMAVLLTGAAIYVVGIGMITYGLYRLWKDNCS